MEMICDLSKKEIAFVRKFIPKTYKKLYKFDITAIDKNCVYTTILRCSENEFILQDDFVCVLGVATKLIQFRRDNKLAEILS